jgi:hypothetical protein
MRADTHYVEALARPRSDRAAGRTEVRADATVRAPGPRAIAVAGDALARSLEDVAGVLGQIAAPGRPLRERLLIELARAEAQRAAWLADALAVLHREPLPALDQADLGRVVSAVADALGPEHRLTGRGPAVDRADQPVLVFGDERLLRVAVAGVLGALCTAVDGRGDPASVTLRVLPGMRAMTHGVEVSQAAVRWSAAVVARLFDAEWADHPCGPTGALQLASARRIAQVQGGALDVQVIESGAARFVFALPAVE